MPRIELHTTIYAPIHVCFNAARSIDLHVLSTQHTGEKAIAGRTEGLIELGETVTWRARHFGIWQTLTSKITEMQYPHFFVDEMTKGAFKSFRHEHHFRVVKDYTEMKDVFVYESPLGLIGNAFNLVVLNQYMTQFFKIRNNIIKEHAERVSA